MQNTGNTYVYGKNPVYEILLKNPKRINKIYFQKGIFFDNRLKKINELAYQNKVQVQYVNLQKFNENFEQKPNFQGVVASVCPVEYIELSDFLNINKQDYKRIVILDGIEDPHNLGAIIRTVAAAGFDAVMVSNTDMNFALVMGSEGKGISKTILNKADFTVKLESNFESLNVSTAAAVIIYEAKRQINLKQKPKSL